MSASGSTNDRGNQPQSAQKSPMLRSHWHAILAALGLPDRSPDADGQAEFSWEEPGNALPVRLPKRLLGMNATIVADGWRPGMHDILRAYRAAEATYVVEIDQSINGRDVTVSICESQYRAAGLATERAHVWAGDLGLAVTLSTDLPTAADDVVEDRATSAYLAAHGISFDPPSPGSGSPRSHATAARSH